MKPACPTSAPLVLVVEDSAECAATIEIAVAALGGIAVQTAASAEEALRILDRGGVAAIITDLHLPSMDGLEFVAAVRRDERHSAVPILVISGDADPGTPVRVLNGGATAFFSKPYSPAAVRRALKELIHGS